MADDEADDEPLDGDELDDDDDGGEPDSDDDDDFGDDDDDDDDGDDGDDGGDDDDFGDDDFGGDFDDDDDEGGGGSGKKKVIIIGAAAFVVIAGAAGGTLMLLGGGESETEHARAADPNIPVVTMAIPPKRRMKILDESTSGGAPRARPKFGAGKSAAPKKLKAGASRKPALTPPPRHPGNRPSRRPLVSGAHRARV